MSQLRKPDTSAPVVVNSTGSSSHQATTDPVFVEPGTVEPSTFERQATLWGLYLVPTPIGNPRDITLRALDVLSAVDFVIAETPEVCRALLRSHSIEHEIISMRRVVASTGRSKDEALTRLAAGGSAALVCDAGTPTVAEPGRTIINRALRLGIDIVSLPGPCAITSALSMSGLTTSQFAFRGTPPRSSPERTSFFRSLSAESGAIVLFESRNYLRSTVRLLIQYLGEERRLMLACDMTKPGEVVLRGSLGSAKVSDFVQHAPRGEFTLVIGQRVGSL